MVWAGDDLAGVLGCKVSSVPMPNIFMWLQVATMIFVLASSEFDDWTKVDMWEIVSIKRGQDLSFNITLWSLSTFFFFFFFLFSLYHVNPPCSAIRAFKIIQECIVCLYCYIFLVLFLSLQHQCPLSWIISVFCCCYSKSDAVDPSNFCPN